ncbi:MAG: NAD(P)H-dependent oxidoreductase subunit E, partial [bacterium]
MKTGDDSARLIHPGSGRRSAAAHPKGRELDDASLAEIDALTGPGPLSRDLLIEYLHLIQDHFGHLAARHLAALAERMKLAMVEVYEVASFYAHFDIVLDGELPPPRLTVRVCESLTCALFGAHDLLANLKNTLGTEVRVVPAPCMGRCAAAPAAMVGQNALENATPQSVSCTVQKAEIKPELPNYQTLDEYIQSGGYSHWKAFCAGHLTSDEIVSRLESSGLRGLGGAGFPSATKWKFVRSQPGPRLMAVNGDEGEPGTFKDRHYLEHEPHRFLEGTLIAARAVEADRVYIYLRDEYPHLREVLAREIKSLESAGFCSPGHLEMRRGAGAYICGEESAMLESIEGKRGYPRQKPPFPTQAGLFGRP